MNRSFSAQHAQEPPTQETLASAVDSDPRWQLALEIVAGPHFVKSSLLSKFLLYVVRETVKGRQGEISEHQIGVSVFGRSSDYRTDEDNIVRNYARQLRKRLEAHFATIGKTGGMRIDIPVGGYVPRFTSDPSDISNLIADNFYSNRALHIEPISSRSRSNEVNASPAPHGATRQMFGRVLLLGIYTAMLVSVTWLVASRAQTADHRVEPTDALWNILFPKGEPAYVVPPDSGLNLLEDMAHAPIQLASYIKSSSLELPAVPLDVHTDQDLRTQQYTDFVSLKIVAMLARVPEFDPQRVFLRFPRDLRIDDLKTANGIIIGSASANPWASIGDSVTNFKIEPGRDMRGATIVNTTPLAGEVARYASHWNEPSHDTYALILFVPNLSGRGHLLVIEGLDVAGTEAAGELLFHPDLLAPILHKAAIPGGGLRPFEVLLRSTSIESNAAGTQVIATRIH